MIITTRLVQDPAVSDAEFWHQKKAHPTKPNIGKVLVLENASTRIGGLALIRRRLHHHERAAEWFKSAYEGLYGGGSPAVDMSRVRVDTTIMAHDNGAVARLDRGRGLRDTIADLGKARTDRIVACVVLGIPCSSSAGLGPSGRPSGRAIEAEVGALLAALDHLAELRGWKMRGKSA